MIKSSVLIRWYEVNKRDLLWRNTKNPYCIWLSEIILQQTRIEQGLPYYKKFIKKYPTVEFLASANQEEVLKLWQGLGYYSRARNLHDTAKDIVSHYNGVFPNTYKELLTLKGVGDYTASAIASICFGEVTPVLDGNVYRFIARYYGIKTPINTPLAKKMFKEVLQNIIAKKAPDVFNQAIMEFGALHCKPQTPHCATCPFSIECYAFNKDEIKELPVKLKSKPVKNRYFNYLVFVSREGKTLIHRREEEDIWKNLYQFPLIETKTKLLGAEVKTKIAKRYHESYTIKEIQLFNKEDIKHKLSHQTIHARYWIVRVEALPLNGIKLNEIKKYPVSVLIEKFLKNFEFE